MNFVLSAQHLLPVEHDIPLEIFSIFVYFFQNLISVLLQFLSFLDKFFELTTFDGRQFDIEVVDRVFGLLFEESVGLFEFSFHFHQFREDIFVVILGFLVLGRLGEKLVGGFPDWILLYFL